mmetsp:Transcript_4993/g.12549  ORF Transcript_4993/g.12549 Transcript_4993/m.12549 type:complete len:229 (-) Transcript_4993:949-1635(-)
MQRHGAFPPVHQQDGGGGSGARGAQDGGVGAQGAAQSRAGGERRRETGCARREEAREGCTKKRRQRRRRRFQRWCPPCRHRKVKRDDCVCLPPPRAGGTAMASHYLARNRRSGGEAGAVRRFLRAKEAHWSSGRAERTAAPCIGRCPDVPPLEARGCSTRKPRQSLASRPAPRREASFRHPQQLRSLGSLPVEETQTPGALCIRTPARIPLEISASCFGAALTATQLP